MTVSLEAALGAAPTPAGDAQPIVQMKDAPSATSAQWPATDIDQRPTDQLINYHGNARKHSDRQIANIVNSIKEWGWTIPILVDESGLVLAGHGRLAAAKKLKMPTVPVMVAKGWTAAQKRAYVLADNQIALNSGFDEELLADEMRALNAADFDLDVIGFEPERLADILKDVEKIVFSKDEVNPSVIKTMHIRWDNRVIPLEVAEADALDAKYDAYITKHGTAVGFVKSLFTAS